MNSPQFARQDNLSIIDITQESTQALAAMAQRNMDLQCTIQDGQIWLNDGTHNVEVLRETRQLAK
mgnify:FL=1